MLLQRHRDVHPVARLHEVPVADLSGAGEPPLLPRLLLEQMRGERAHAAEDQDAGKDVEAREVTVEDRERVRHVAESLRGLSGVDADDAVEARPARRDAHAAAPFGLATTRQPFVPPKANELTSAAATGISRAVFGT